MKLLLAIIAASAALHAQDPLEGLWTGYDGEFLHVSRQLVSLAEAIPAPKYSWRPAPGVRSVGEVVMHIAVANFYLLSNTGVKLPPGMKPDLEKTVTSKDEAIDWLKRSLDAVAVLHPKVKPAEMARRVKNGDHEGTVEGMYLRILVHCNEHMGQLVAYARMNGIVPPWSN